MEYKLDFEERKDVLKFHFRNITLYFVPSSNGNYKFCTKNSTPEEKQIQSWMDKAKRKEVLLKQVPFVIRDAICNGLSLSDINPQDIIRRGFGAINNFSKRNNINSSQEIIPELAQEYREEIKRLGQYGPVSKRERRELAEELQRAFNSELYKKYLETIQQSDNMKEIAGLMDEMRSNYGRFDVYPEDMTKRHPHLAEKMEKLNEYLKNRRNAQIELGESTKKGSATPERVKELLNIGATPHNENSNMDIFPSTLRWAISLERTDLELIRLIVEKGGRIDGIYDVDHNDGLYIEKIKYSMLSYAATSFKPEAFKLLLELGASTDISMDEIKEKYSKGTDNRKKVEFMEMLLQKAKLGEDISKIKIPEDVLAPTNTVRYSPELKKREGVIKLQLATDLDIYFVPQTGYDGTTIYEFCTKNENQQQRAVQLWIDNLSKTDGYINWVKTFAKPDKEWISDFDKPQISREEINVVVSIAKKVLKKLIDKRELPNNIDIVYSDERVIKEARNEKYSVIAKDGKNNYILETKSGKQYKMSVNYENEEKVLTVRTSSMDNSKSWSFQASTEKSKSIEGKVFNLNVDKIFDTNLKITALKAKDFEKRLHAAITLNMFLTLKKTDLSKVEERPIEIKDKNFMAPMKDHTL